MHNTGYVTYMYRVMDRTAILVAMKQKKRRPYIFSATVFIVSCVLLHICLFRSTTSKSTVSRQLRQHHYNLSDHMHVRAQQFTKNTSHALAFSQHNISFERVMHSHPSIPRKATTSVQRFQPKSVIMAFAMSTEIDLLHVKLELLYEYVDLFIVCECKFAQNGLPKTMHFDAHKNESRFRKFRSKLVYLIDEKDPHNTGKALGWEQEQRPKIVLGEYILHHTHRWHPESIVFMSDMDEFPAVDTLLWAKNHVKQGETAVFDTRYFLYNFHLLIAPASRATMTVRQLQDETRFWTHKISKGVGAFPQQIISPPKNVHPGYHCGYCQTSDLNVLKLQYTNAVDGPPFLTDYYWDVEIFAKMRSCGVSPRCNKLTRVHEDGDAFSLYDYTNNSPMDTCDSIQISPLNWHKVNPELQKCEYIRWNISVSPISVSVKGPLA